MTNTAALAAEITSALTRMGFAPDPGYNDEMTLVGDNVTLAVVFPLVGGEGDYELHTYDTSDKEEGPVLERVARYDVDAETVLLFRLSVGDAVAAHNL